MSFGQNPKDNSLGSILDRSGTSASINQIRGVSVANNTGAGIPRQVTGVQVSVSNANTGSTCVVTITFHRDPSDASFSTANIYVRNYNGNPANVRVASGANSPISFVLNNTGESIVVSVQASGNAGDAPLASSPTTGIKLPQSASGGFGPSSAAGITGTGIAGTLVEWTGKTSIGAANLTNDATTNASTAVTVRGIQTIPVSSSAPNTGDAFRFNEYGSNSWDLANPIPRWVMVVADGGSNPFVQGCSSNQPVTVGTRSLVSATSTEMPADTYASSAVGSTQMTACIEWGFGASQGSFCFGTFRRYTTRARFNQTTNCRFFCGLGNASPQFGTSVYSTDTPNFPAVYFRYSSGTDSHIVAICNVDSTHQTVVDTGVAVDTTNSQLFDIAQFASGYRFYINGSLVATITSNLPSASSLWATLLGADNKNTANVVSVTLWDAIVITK